ncbi:MAG: AMP-binding protein [Pseudomonadota bacterium]
MSSFAAEPLLLPAMIELNGRNLPDKPALIVGDETKSWSEFAAATAAVANALAGLGLRPGDRVAVLMSNGRAMAEALFGIVRGGFVAVPLNVAVSDEAAAGMIADCAAAALIATDDHAHRIDSLPAPPVERRLCDRPRAGWLHLAAVCTDASTEPPAVRVTPESECNIIYSSGTTGLPKGIVHDHRCRAAWACDMSVGLRYHSGARTLCSLGLYSNISWVAMLATILAGGTLYVMPRFDVRGCLRLIESAAITHTAMVPVQLQRLLDHDGFSPARVRSMQSVMCCGSPLAPAQKRQLVAAFGGAFMELYGLTEGLVTILSPEDIEARLDSVGRPCAGQAIRIIDADDRPCPAGVAGEIVGRGPLLMAGYHNREDADREATWHDEAGRPWLRTGDIGRLDDDGFLYLVDRKKDMIISGGQNVYPADIEAVLRGHEAIADVAVIGVASQRWGETPLAVVVAAGDVDGEELLGWANGLLGRQQRISGVEFVAELPRNPNGKVLKRTLRERFAGKTFA